MGPQKSARKSEFSACCWQPRYVSLMDIGTTRRSDQCPAVATDPTRSAGYAVIRACPGCAEREGGLKWQVVHRTS